MCDKRRKKSEIASDFPDYLFEEGFTEEDVTWDPEIRETPEELDVRATKVLDVIFDNDEEQCTSRTLSLRAVTYKKTTFPVISITSHHGFIDAFLRVCGHRPWALPTGGEYLYAPIWEGGTDSSTRCHTNCLESRATNAELNAHYSTIHNVCTTRLPNPCTSSRRQRRDGVILAFYIPNPE